MRSDFEHLLQQARQWFVRLSFQVDSSGRRRLYRKLAKMIGHGVPILTAIESIRDRRIAAGDRIGTTTQALNEWATQLRNGKNLSEAIGRWVGHEEAMLISAGEKAGTMETALLSAVRVMEARSQIKGAVFRGLAYPTVVLCLGVAVLYLFGFKIVPAFNKAVKSADAWHGMAHAVVSVAMWAKAWLWAVGVAAAAVIIAFVVSLRYWDGPARVWLDKYPPYSIYRVVHGSTWLIALAALVEAGLKIETALEQLREQASPWLAERIGGALSGMRSGFNLGDALARAGHQFPDQEIIDDLGVYASLSGFDGALLLLGREWLEGAVTEIRDRMTVVFGFSIVLVGGLIAFMVGGMLDMQVQMSQLMQQRLR
ncbi:MAG: type II secretion system F family protein [Pseudomonadota bacterium]